MKGSKKMILFEDKKLQWKKKLWTDFIELILKIKNKMNWIWITRIASDSAIYKVYKRRKRSKDLK